jgi:hypothetical protein
VGFSLPSTVGHLSAINSRADLITHKYVTHIFNTTLDYLLVQHTKTLVIGFT